MYIYMAECFPFYRCALGTLRRYLPSRLWTTEWGNIVEINKYFKSDHFYFIFIIEQSDDMSCKNGEEERAKVKIGKKKKINKPSTRTLPKTSQGLK